MLKKILVTGAGGFIGGFIVEEALRRGYETWAGVRASTNKEYLKDENIKFVDLKFNDKEQLKKQLYRSFNRNRNRPQAIYHDE